MEILKLIMTLIDGLGSVLVIMVVIQYYKISIQKSQLEQQRYHVIVNNLELVQQEISILAKAISELKDLGNEGSSGYLDDEVDIN